LSFQTDRKGKLRRALIIHLRMKVCNTQEPEKCVENIDAIADSGSFNTWIPRREAERIGLKELGRKKFKTINGQIVERAYGAGVCTVDGASGVSEIVFGEPSDATVLGALTMEELGIKIDPKNGKITREDVFLAV
jgi:predicted aspartyl protease